MISLLLLSYKSFQALPARLSDFYDSLFQTLLQRHDGTKPGFSRHRRCKLDDSQYRELFEALCIFAKKDGRQSFPGDAIFDIAEKAIKHCAVAASPKDYVEDIVQITCLLLRDGEEHRFIHKTVHEYYTASYIRKRPEKWAHSFYEKAYTALRPFSWNQELAFLGEIDAYRYNKFHLLPAILNALTLKETDLDSPENGTVPVDLDRLFQDVTIQFRPDKYGFLSIGPLPTNPISRQLIDTISPSLSARSMDANHLNQATEQFGGERPLVGHSQETTNHVVLLSTHLKQKEYTDLVAILKQECERLHKIACEIHKTSSVQENPSFLEDLT